MRFCRVSEPPAGRFSRPSGALRRGVFWQLERVYLLDYTMANAADVLEKRGDGWSGIYDAKQDVPYALG